MNEIRIRMNFENDFRERYLLNGNPYIFSVSKVGNIYISYVSNYTSLRFIEGLDEYNAIEILEGILIIIENLKDYFFKPNEYIINENNIFIQFDKECVIDTKLLFIKNKEECDEKSIICNLIYSMYKKTNSDGRCYLDKILKYIELSHPNYISLLKMINEIKAEIKTFKKY